MWNRAHIASASPIVASGEMVIGSSIIPASERLTTSTWWAWSSMDRLRWMMPSPPCRAMATAIRASVTVSIGEETSGTRTVIRLDTRDAVVTCGRDDVALRRLQQHVVEGQAEPFERLRHTGGTEIIGRQHGPAFRASGWGLHAISAAAWLRRAPAAGERGRATRRPAAVGGQQGVEDLALLLGLVDQRAQLAAGPVLGDPDGVGAHAQLLTDHLRTHAQRPGAPGPRASGPAAGPAAGWRRAGRPPR